LENKKPIGEILRDSFYYIPSNIVPALCGLLSLTIFTGLIAPEHFAQYVLSLTTVTLAANIGFSWLYYSGFRYFDESKNNLSQFYSTTLISLFVLLAIFSILGCLCASILNNYYELKETSYMILLSVPLLLTKIIFDQLLLFIRADGRAKAYSVIRSIDALAKILLAVLFISFFGMGYEGIIYGMAISFAILAIYEMYKLNAWQYVRLRYFSASLMKKLFYYGLPLMGVGLTGSILSVSDRYLIAYYCSEVDVGLYGAGYRLAEMVIDTPSAILLMAYVPILIKVFNESGEKGASELLSNIFRLIALILIPAVTGAIILSKDIVALFLDERYFNAHILFFWICTATFFVCINHLYTRVFELKKATNKIFLISSLAAASNILMNIFLIPTYGYIGAAISTLLAYLIQIFLSYYEARKIMKIQIPIRSIVNAMVGSVVMYTSILYLSDYFVAPAWLAFIVKVVVGILVYVFTLRILKESLLTHFMPIYKRVSP
jgi:O-antigen/teichoic acid export membrane protein